MSHYFDEQPAVGSEVRTVDVALADIAFTLDTDRGVFSHGHVDTGTALLLREAPAPPRSGDLLDLGCGAGVIALTLALRSPDATVWAVDTNERARALTAKNARRAGADNVRVCAPHEVPADLRFATIWSNPPIRIGKAALRELLTGWLARLTDDGTAVLVVQKHLGADSLQRWLDSEGFATTRRAGRAGFRLLQSSARPSQTTGPDAHDSTSGAEPVGEATIENGVDFGERDHQKVEDPSGMKRSEATCPLET